MTDHDHELTIGTDQDGNHGKSSGPLWREVQELLWKGRGLSVAVLDAKAPE